MAIALCSAPFPGNADPCAAATSLAAIHDAYVALAKESGEIRQQAAVSLLALLLPAADPAAIAADLADSRTPPDEARLRHILKDAAEIARAVATNDGDLHEDHVSNADWMAEIIVGTGCHVTWTRGQTADVTTAENASRTGSLQEAFWKDPAIFAGIAALLAAVAALRRSRPFRRRKLPRLPRTPVRLQATATLANGHQEKVEVFDISRGGMKVALRNAPRTGAPVSLRIGHFTLPASVAWRNNFYAGLLFDAQLSKDTHDQLVALGSLNAGDRQAPASRSEAALR